MQWLSFSDIVFPLFRINECFLTNPEVSDMLQFTLNHLCNKNYIQIAIALKWVCCYRNDCLLFAAKSCRMPTIVVLEIFDSLRHCGLLIFNDIHGVLLIFLILHYNN